MYRPHKNQVPITALRKDRAEHGHVHGPSNHTDISDTRPWNLIDGIGKERRLFEEKIRDSVGEEPDRACQTTPSLEERSGGDECQIGRLQELSFTLPCAL